MDILTFSPATNLRCVRFRTCPFFGDFFVFTIPLVLWMSFLCFFIHDDDVVSRAALSFMRYEIRVSGVITFGPFLCQ
jgi:hypothetical protein